MSKSVFLSIILTVCCIGRLSSQSIKDSAAVLATAFNYAEGYYAGDAQRMESALYPDINKGKAGTVSDGSSAITSTSTYEGLIEGTRARIGVLEHDKRKLTVSVVQMNDEVANVRIRSAKFNDEVQMIKSGGQWKIINVLWTDGLDASGSPRAAADPHDILRSAELYMTGIQAGDVKRLESVVVPEFNKVTFSLFKETGALRLQKQKYSSLIENCAQKVGAVDEPKRSIRVRLIDAMDNIAVCEIAARSAVEYVQMLRTSGGWKIFNALFQSVKDSPFSESLPAIAGHPMPGFSLPVYGGGTYSPEQHRGKNIVLIFLRGSAGKSWCTICQYQYAEFTDRALKDSIRQRYNLDIEVVLPYTEERISDFLNTIPDALQKTDQWKHPASDAPASRKESAAFMQSMFARTLSWTAGPGTPAIPILIDSSRTVSKRLQLFTTFWDQVSAEQNIPAVFILDTGGIVRYKYVSQTTLDRPSWDVIETFLKTMIRP